MIAANFVNVSEVMDVNCSDVAGLMIDDSVVADFNSLMVDMHLPLVERLAREFDCVSQIRVDHDDLVNAGILGLIEAINDYAPNDAEDFEEFCEPMIEDALLDALRYASWFSEFSETLNN